MNREPDCIGKVTLISTALGGKSNAVRSGYRPQHLIHENYQTSGLHEYERVIALEPGQSARARVWFVRPEVYPATIWPGRVLDLFEGSMHVGTLEVIEVFNTILPGNPESFIPIWVASTEGVTDFSVQCSPS